MEAFAFDHKKKSLDVRVESELDEQRWAVISFEHREASDLTYKEAVRKLDEIEAAGVAGLCIVTDETAARVGKRK